MAETVSEALVAAIRSGGVGMPPGMGPDEVIQQLPVLTDEQVTWLVHLLIQRRLDREDMTSLHAYVQARVDTMEEMARSGAIRVEDIQRRVARLDQLIRPLVSLPDSPPARSFEWRNLWAFWQFVPGTIRPRVLLTLWTFKDWWAIGAVLWGVGSWLPWHGFSALGVLGLVSVLLFGVHEVWFRWWGQRVCKLAEVDPHEYALTFTPTFERFVSRYMA